MPSYPCLLFCKHFGNVLLVKHFALYWQNECKVIPLYMLHHQIVNLCERLSKGDKEGLNAGFSGKPINKAISKLSNRLVADMFTEDGRPNLKVFSFG